MSKHGIFDHDGYVKLPPRVGDEPYKPRKSSVSEEETRTCLECPKKTCRGGVCKRLAEVKRRIKQNAV